jgi:hypothetical protein
VALSVAAVPAREVFGVSMQEVVKVANWEIRLNGIGIFKEKTFFKVYVGLYLEKPTADAEPRLLRTRPSAQRFSLSPESKQAPDSPLWLANNPVVRQKCVRAQQFTFRENSPFACWLSYCMCFAPFDYCALGINPSLWRT